ncbi:MAG: hypothetical protein LBI09_02805 [Nitrososphaerota archaeon]|nr:hypothetical protein [Nitrososphaerota archaeon]
MLISQAILDMHVPLIGTSLVTLPTQFTTDGVSITVLATSAFQWPLYLAITTATLCILARIYHKKLAQQKTTTPPPPMT